MTAEGVPLTSSFDSAFATMDDDARKPLTARIPLPIGVREAKRGETAYFCGATTDECKRAVIHDVAAEAVILYRIYDSNYGYTSVPVLLRGLIQCDAGQPVQGGDSGCLLFDQRGYALGILLGADATDTYPYFARLQPILDEFGLAMVTASDVPGSHRVTDLIP